MKIKLGRYKYIIIVFLIATLPRIVLAVLGMPLKTRADEFGTIAGASILGGFDWSYLLSQTAYYGFGLTIWFGPLFRVIQDPILIYKVMLIVLGILQGAVSIIAYNILKNYLRITDEKKLCLISIISSYCVVTRNVVVFNETALIFISWITAWILLALDKYNENKKKRLVLTLLLLFVLGYSLLLHTRAITFWIALILVVLGYFIFFRKSLIDLKIGVPFALICFTASKIIIKLVQNNLWSADGPATVANTSVQLELSALFKPSTWHAWLNIVLGQINTLTMVTGGLLLIGIVISILLAYSLIIKKEFNILNRQLLLLFSFFGACIGITIIGQSVSEWLPRLVDIMNKGFNSSNYGVKVLTYVRYAGPYLAPFIFAALIFILFEDKKKNLTIIKRTGIILIVIQIYWFVCILPYAYNNSVINETFLPFALWNNYDKETRFLTFVPGSIILIIVFILIYVLIKKKKKEVLLSVLSIFFIYQFIYNGVVQDIKTEKINWEETGKTSVVLQELSDDLPEIIYVEDTKNSDHQTYYDYQYMLFNKTILNEEPSEETEEAVYVTNSKYSVFELVHKGYKVHIVDEENDEYILIKGERLQDLFQKNGYSLEDYIIIWRDIKNAGTVMDNTVIDEEGNIISDGSEGYLVEEQNLTFKKGVLALKMSLLIDDVIGKDIGEIEVVTSDDENILMKKALTKDMIEENEINLELQTQCGNTNSLQIRLYLNSGSKVTLTNLEYARCSDDYDLGQEVPEEMSKLSAMINALDAEAQVFYVMSDDIYDQSISLDYLKALLPNAELRTVGENELLNISKTRDQFLIMSQDWDTTWDLLDQYTIIQKNAHYTVYINSDSELLNNVENAGGKIYSNENGISLNYFNTDKMGQLSDNNGLTLKLGSYAIHSKIKVENIPEYLGTFEVKEKTMTSTEAEYIYDGEWWNSTVQLENYNISEYVSMLNHLEKNVSIADSEIYIKRLSDTIEVDLESLELIEAEYELKDNIVVTNGSESEAIKGPYYDMALGKYRAIFTYSLKEYQKDSFGAAKVMEAGISLGGVTLNVQEIEDIENIVVEVPFEVKGGGMHGIEFVTRIDEGTILELKSISLILDED